MDINKVLSALQIKLEECKQKKEELYTNLIMRQNIELEERIHTSMDFCEYKGKCDMLTYAINLIQVALTVDKYVEKPQGEIK